MSPAWRGTGPGWTGPSHLCQCFGDCTWSSCGLVKADCRPSVPGTPPGRRGHGHQLGRMGPFPKLAPGCSDSRAPTARAMQSPGPPLPGWATARDLHPISCQQFFRHFSQKIGIGHTGPIKWKFYYLPLLYGLHAMGVGAAPIETPPWSPQSVTKCLAWEHRQVTRWGQGRGCLSCPGAGLLVHL